MSLFASAIGFNRIHLLWLASILAVASVHAAENADMHLSVHSTQLAINSRNVASAVDNSISKLAPVTKSKHTAKRLTNKALTPLRATFIQLGRPLEWLNSARHHIWPSAVVATKEIFYLDSLDSPRLLNVKLAPQTVFRLGDSVPALSTRVSLLGDYELPISHEVMALSRATATELQVRMADDWSMLYVVDRTNTDLNNYTVSVGLGLRHSF